MRVAEYSVPVTTTGSAGSASGSADSPPIMGELLAVKLDYDGSAPATTKVDLDELGGAARKILNKAASATDVTHYPRVQMQDNTGANLTGIYERFFLAGRKVRVAVTSSNALAPALTVTFLVLEQGTR